jgi:hypothetical protein
LVLGVFQGGLSLAVAVAVALVWAAMRLPAAMADGLEFNWAW